MGRLHLITGEFPPQPGGVSDYAWGVAAGLGAQGEEVHVWCPPAPAPPPEDPPGVVVHRDLGRFAPRDLRSMDRALDLFPGPRRLLVQWVPHSFGLRSVNLPFCLWLLHRARRHGDRVEVMVHEPYLAFAPRGLRYNLAASVHRLMTVVLLRAAHRVWVSTPAWAKRWRRYTLSRAVPFEWIPIPSGVPVVDDAAGVAAARRRAAPSGGTVIGHFGTYRPAVTGLLRPILTGVLERDPTATVLLLGRGGAEFRAGLCGERPDLADRVTATGGLPAADLSLCVQACDVMVQPFPDGMNGRQSSVAALLAHGCAVVTTTGPSTEEELSGADAMMLVATGAVEPAVAAVLRLLDDPAARERLGTRARALYAERFDLRLTLAALRAPT